MLVSQHFQKEQERERDREREGKGIPVLEPLQNFEQWLSSLELLDKLLKIAVGMSEVG